MSEPTPQQMQLTLPSLGINLLAILPAATPEGDNTEIPAGTILLGTGRGDWQWGERHLVHGTDENGQLVCIDLARHLVIRMAHIEARTSCLALVPPEPYPFQSLEEALEATRKGLPLFAAPIANPTT